MDLNRNSSDSEDNEDEWEEMETQEEITKCLFCDNSENSVDSCIEHLKAAHQFDLAVLKGRFRMDQYSYVKVGS